jgi:hypothetical protein
MTTTGKLYNRRQTLSNVELRNKIMGLQRQIRKLREGVSSQKCRDDNYALTVALSHADTRIAELEEDLRLMTEGFEQCGRIIKQLEDENAKLRKAAQTWAEANDNLIEAHTNLKAVLEEK